MSKWLEFLVTTLADEDNGSTNGTSLREAIQLANSNGNSGVEDVITFATGLQGGTITLTLGSLVITDDLRIDGDVLGDTAAKDTGRADDITITTATIENHASGITVAPRGYTSPGPTSLEQAVGTFGDFRIFEIRQDGTDAAFNALTLTGAGVYDFGRNPLLPSYNASGAAIYQADFEAGSTRLLPGQIRVSVYLERGCRRHCAKYQDDRCGHQLRDQRQFWRRGRRRPSIYHRGLHPERQSRRLRRRHHDDGD